MFLGSRPPPPPRAGDSGCDTRNGSFILSLLPPQRDARASRGRGGRHPSSVKGLVSAAHFSSRRAPAAGGVPVGGPRWGGGGLVGAPLRAPAPGGERGTGGPALTPRR